MAVSIDWLGWTFFPKGSDWIGELSRELVGLFGVEGWERKGGWQGYECSARVDGAIVAWGGAAQRGSVHVELPGSVCQSVRDWGAVAKWLTEVEARITRVDIAGDDYFGERVNVEWAIAQFHAGGFVTQGRPPAARLVDDLGSGSGRTLYVGRRENGKLCRVYEKGKELGDRLSTWVRFEVEWRAKDRVLGVDMLTRPSEFIAGSYPCAALFSAVRTRIRAVRERALICYEKMVAVARLHAGRAVHVMLQVTGGDVGKVVALLRRSGLPRRLIAPDVAALTCG
jgi:phage replication initiation protein